MKHGKVINSIPPRESMFNILVTQTAKTGDIKILFKIRNVLNDQIKENKQLNGVYCFSKHSHIFKWLFLEYNRHINKDCLKFLFNHMPEMLEELLGVNVLPSKLVSAKKFNSHFAAKYKGCYQELFSTTKPDVWEENEDYYLVKTSLNGSVFEELVFFFVHKDEYNEWKSKFGSTTPFVVTNSNQVAL